MPETFLILLSGGTMLAAAVSDPRAVVLQWLRLAGIIALSLAGLAGFFIGLKFNLWWILTLIAILGQLAFVQVARRKTQQVLAAAAFACAVMTGSSLLHSIKPMNLPLLLATGAAASATLGLALMDMLLGHAYLTAAQMTMRPFIRLNVVLGAAMLVRAVFSIAGTVIIQSAHPVQMFWNFYGLLIGTRWLVGFIVPGIFIFMAHDCIKRRATQSATGILYVAGVLVFIGEAIGLYLMSQTGMPL